MVYIWSNARMNTCRHIIYLLFHQWIIIKHECTLLSCVGGVRSYICKLIKLLLKILYNLRVLWSKSTQYRNIEIDIGTTQAKKLVVVY